MRKPVGALATIAVLCALSWSQAPAQVPPPEPSQAPASSQDSPASGQAPTPNPPSSNQSGATSSIPTPTKPPGPAYPLTELFAGYSFAQAGFFNAGHWAQLSGWNASLSLNLDRWIGLVFDGGQVFGETQIPTGAIQAPFPNCPQFCPLTSPTFNADTREYSILFGAQFPYRKHERWTPFGELLFGHDGVRGIAKSQPPGGYVSEVSGGLALVAGAGADYRINERYAVRIKADYLQTRTSFALIGKAKQDNLQVSVGLVIRSVKKKKRRLEDETGVEQ